jgi:hypothetical protein
MRSFVALNSAKAMKRHEASLHKFLPCDYVTDTLNAKQVGNDLQDLQSRIIAAAAMTPELLIRM